VAVRVGPLNDAPAAAAGTTGTDEDHAVTIMLVGSDVDGDGLSFAIASGPTAGTLGAITQLTPTTARVPYTPGANAHGDDAFTFTVSDGAIGSAPAPIAVHIASINDGPTVANVSATTDEDTALTLTLTGSDVDGDALTFAIAAGPSRGT